MRELAQEGHVLAAQGIGNRVHIARFFAKRAQCWGEGERERALVRLAIRSAQRKIHHGDGRAEHVQIVGQGRAREAQRQFHARRG